MHPVYANRLRVLVLINRTIGPVARPSGCRPLRSARLRLERVSAVACEPSRARCSVPRHQRLYHRGEIGPGGPLPLPRAVRIAGRGKTAGRSLLYRARPDLVVDYFLAPAHHLGTWYREDGPLSAEQVAAEFADLLYSLRRPLQPGSNKKRGIRPTTGKTIWCDRSCRPLPRRRPGPSRSARPISEPGVACGATRTAGGMLPSRQAPRATEGSGLPTPHP